MPEDTPPDDGDPVEGDPDDRGREADADDSQSEVDSDDSQRETDVGAPSEADPFPVTGTWNREQMSAFFEDAVIPIRLGCRTPGGGLWMLSLWYRYHDGALWCATAESADVVSYLRADPQVSFEVSVNDPPYRGVRGQGTVTIEPDPEKDLLCDLIVRYLGDTDSALAERLLDRDRTEVTLRIDPRKVYTWDYGDRMRDAVE